MYDKAPLEQHYSPSVSELVARLLITDPERRPSAREILEILTAQEDPITVNQTENKALSSLDKSLGNISLNSDTLLVTSTGPTAEYQGDMLGIYKKVGTNNSRPYYKQEDTVRSDVKEYLLYSTKKGDWAMGTAFRYKINK